MFVAYFEAKSWHSVPLRTLHDFQFKRCFHPSFSALGPEEDYGSCYGVFGICLRISTSLHAQSKQSPEVKGKKSGPLRAEGQSSRLYGLCLYKLNLPFPQDKV